MSSRVRAAAERINETVSIVQVLDAYGYDVRLDAEHREQQFRCDLHGSGHDDTPSARVYPDSNSWYCVAIRERVLTSQGWAILKAQQDLGRAVLDGDGEFSVPIAYWDRGIQDCVTVRTNAGYQATLTLDHEVDVVGRGWVRAGDIQVGDHLVSTKPSVLSFGEENRRLPCDVQDLNTRVYQGMCSLSLPEEWSGELGELLGYVFGDGWVMPRTSPHSGVVGITSSAEDAEDARTVFGYLRGWAGGRGSDIHRTGKVRTPNGQEYQEDQYVFTLGNDGVCEWFSRLDMGKETPPAQRRMPNSIWAAPRDAIRGFLRGIFATDGSIFRPKGRLGIRIHLYSVSEGFLLDVQLLLLQFGIHSRVHRPASTRPGGVWYLQVATGLDILTFRDRVGVANRRKAAVLSSFRYNPRGSRPFKPTVVSVLPAGPLPVADITMPGSPTFIAGGIKVHNCFGCGLTRDAIETVQIKEGIGFWLAVKKLERAYGLKPLPIDYGVDGRGDEAIRAIEKQLITTTTFADEEARLRSRLDGLTRDRDTPLDSLLGFWGGFDKVIYMVRGPRGDGGVWSEQKGQKVLADLRLKIEDKINGTDTK